jgi:S1-C subfamily serine protease
MSKVRKCFRLFIIIFGILFASGLLLGIISLKVDLERVVEIFEHRYNEVNNGYNKLLQNQLDLVAQMQELERLSSSTNIALAKEVKQITDTIKELQSHNVDVARLLKTDVFVSGYLGSGAGTVVKKTNDGIYVLTCLHVIDDIVHLNEKGLKVGAKIGYSTYDDSTKVRGMVIYGADIIKIDRDHDLALLKTGYTDDNLEVATIAKEAPKKGDTVYSVGSPLGILRTASKGIISNIIEGFFYFDGTITFGNSGGGLYNEHGELVGVPSNVEGYPIGTDEFVPESGLGMCRDLTTITNFLEGEL